MGVESRGWPRGRRFSKEVHFPFSSKNFRMTFFRKVHSSAKFSDDLFQFFGFLALVFHFLHNSGPLSQNWPRGSVPSDPFSTRPANIIGRLYQQHLFGITSCIGLS